MKTSTDVANRALQHVGAQLIAADALWTEDTKNASEIRACYDDLRRAELRRNVWRFAIRRVPLRKVDDTTYMLVAADWDEDATYLANTVVKFDDILFISRREIAAGVEPRTSSDWVEYFGPLSVTPWDDETTYYAGELVYTPSNTGYAVYLSTQNENDDTPGTVEAWDVATTYGLGVSVTHSAATWVSHLILNVGNTPGAVANWNSGTTYAMSDQVVASDGNVYSSVAGGNLNHNPATDTTHTYWTFVSVSPWISVPASQVGINQGKWSTINASLEPVNISYPLAIGPSRTNEMRNIFMLPSGFLREAPQDPKAGSVSFLGAPSGLMYSDWLFESGFIITRNPDPIVLRFVADVSDVDSFDSMFYEGLAARIAIAVAEPLTQSVSKLSSIASQYKQFMGEARTVNGIETGPTEPPEDDLITCRI